MRQVRIVGVGITSFGKFLDRSLRSLATEAVGGAFSDAGISPDQVDAVFSGNAAAGLITDQEMIRGQVALRETGLLGKPIYNIENACASGSSALNLAWMAVAAGQCDIALALGAEKMAHEDKVRTFRALASAVDLEEVRAGGGGGIDDVVAGGGTRSNFMDIYANQAKAYMERSGATQRHFAEVAVKSHKFASMNPHAQYRQRMTVDEVLAAREVSWPLTVPMCSPIGDGAAAVVVCSDEVADRLGADGVDILASVVVSGSLEAPHAMERAIARAYEVSGVGPEDLDVVECHDAAAPAELMCYESIGLCGPGEGVKLLEAGETDLGGRVPVNTSGGLLSKGHPVGATGVAQVVELVTQLRGRAAERQVNGARVGLAQNGGGTIGSDAGAMAVTIVAKR